MYIKRKDRCRCGSGEIQTKWNAGFDIDGTGEEKQHFQICLSCGSTRFYIERLSFDDGDRILEEFYSNWESKK